MSLEKVLQKIHGEIKDLAPLLELFLDDTIQPSAKDCEKLQSQLSALQENVAVYKYNKSDKEISPSFNIHAKVSQKETDVKAIVTTLEDKEQVRHQETQKENTNTETESGQGTTHKKKYPNLAVSLNDKFRFINELFAQNSSEYNIALEQLNNLKNWNDTEIYLNSLKSLYEWRENSEIVKHFYAIVKKRFE